MKRETAKHQGLIKDLLNNPNGQENKEKNISNSNFTFGYSQRGSNIETKKEFENIKKSVTTGKFYYVNPVMEEQPEGSNKENNEQQNENIPNKNDLMENIPGLDVSNEGGENRVDETLNKEKFFYNQSWSERSTGSKAGFILSIFPGLGLPFLFNLIYHKCSCNCCATIDKSSINSIEEDKKSIK